MRKICCVLFFFFHLSAEEDPQVVREADAYFEAKEYERAYDLYESLSQGKAATWQKERIQYNLGTILLAKGEYEAALRHYSKIPYLEKGAPFLTRSLQINLAILFYRKALAAENESETFFYLRTALNHIEKALLAECELEKMKNRSDCVTQQDLIELSGAVRNQLAIALKKYGESRVSDVTLKEGIPFLISGTNLAESHLDFLELIGGANPLFGQYLQLFANDLKSWGILWESLDQKQEALSKPYQEFQKGIQLMEESAFRGSRVAFLDAESQLSSLMRKMWGRDPLKELLGNLLTTYQYALDQVPVQPATLYQLVNKQEQIVEVLKDGQLFHEYLEYSDRQLQASLEFARAGQRILSRYYLEEARQWIKRALRDSKGEPDDTLEAVIEDQQHALTLNHLLRRMENGEYNPSSLLEGAQQFALNTAEPFIQEVLKYERDNWPKVCQCKPWDRVIPLFVQGEEAASLARGLLEQDAANPASMRLQEKALGFWKEALLVMRQPERFQEEREEQKPDTSSETPLREEGLEKKQPIKEIQRQLQSMYRDDRKLSPLRQPTQKEIRPW